LIFREKTKPLKVFLVNVTQKEFKMRFAKLKNLEQDRKEKLDEQRFFINILKPLKDKNIDEIITTSKISSEQHSCIREPTPVISLKCNTNDKIELDKRESRIGYKVLAIKDNGCGIKTIFDHVDGTVYNCSITNKISKFVPLFDSKSAALSERCAPYKVSNCYFITYLFL